MVGSRCARTAVLSAALLPASTTLALAQGSPLPRRDEQIQQQFDQVRQQFRVSPYGYYYYYNNAFYYFRPYYAYGSISNPYWPSPSQRYAYDPGRVPEWVREPPLAISRERTVTAMLLIVGVRVLLYLAAVALMSQLLPKRVWSQVLDGDNRAVAIVLAAIVISLAIVIAAPGW